MKLQKPRAFSLVELLVVAAIVLLLAVLITPAINGLLSNNRVTDAGARLAALIEWGRMHATVQHCVVSVRFFQNPADSSEFTAADLIELVPDPAAPQTLRTNTLVPVFRLPDSIILSRSYSSLLAADSSAGNGSAALPGEASRSYRNFLIFPDGSTSLDSTTPNPWLGVLDRHDAASGQPRDPLVLSLDPRTCHVSVYRK